MRRDDRSICYRDCHPSLFEQAVAAVMGALKQGMTGSQFAHAACYLALPTDRPLYRRTRSSISPDIFIRNNVRSTRCTGSAGSSRT